MDPVEPSRHLPVPGEAGNPEERHLYQPSSGMTLEELHQWREIMINPMMAVNPLLTVPGQQKIPLVPSAFEPPVIERDLLPSTLTPPDPRQFCIASQFGSSVLPNINMPNTLSHRVYSGWGILPPESIKAMARRNEMIQRQNSARMEMEMHAIYQQRKIEKINPTGLAGIGVPFLFGSDISAGSAPCHVRSMHPASDMHFHRSTLRNLSRSPMLVATGSNFVESWRQKYRRLKKGTGSQKVPDSDTESCKSQAEENILNQMPAIPGEENEYAKDPETAALSNQKSRETKEKSTTALASTCGGFEPTYQKAWGAHATLLEKEDWDGGNETAPEQGSENCSEKNGLCPLVPPSCLPGIQGSITRGTHALDAMRGNLSLDEDIQKWTVSDVYNFISGLPGCSDYAQVFQDHAIDGETLPLLTEEHLRSTMGLKLGPALKIQSQVSQHIQSMFYKKNLLHPSHAKETFGQLANTPPLLDFNSWGDTLDMSCSQDMTAPKGIERDILRN